jgi:hypothetical protein
MKLQYPLKNWNKGLVTRIEEFSISPQSVSDMLNFTTQGDRMELRRGMNILGDEIRGNGYISGLHTAYKKDGTQLLYSSYSRKVRYYNENGEKVFGGLDGTPSGAIISGGSISFDGADDYVSIADADIPASTFTSGFTISAWIYANTYGESGGRIIDKSSGTPGVAGFALATGTSNKLIMVINNGTQISSGTISYGEWMFITTTVDSSGLVTHYINGQISGTPGNTTAPSAITTTTALRIGNRAGATDRSFDGLMDYVCIYNRALDSGEVAKIYGIGRNYTNINDGLVAQYSGSDYSGTEATPTSILDVKKTYWVEVSSDILPADADGEDIAFASYSSPVAGTQLFFSSPNSGLWQIITANPGTAINLYDATKNFKGYITTKNNRLWLWNRNEANSVIYLSYIDNILEQQTTVTDEAIAGSGATRTGTLAFKAGGSKRQCYAVTFTDTVETFVDNYDGTLTGSAGGTGTINYATGAYSITFAASATTVTADYLWFDATDEGIADFTYGSPRAAGEGTFFQQGDGSGRALSVMTFGGVFYCFHEKKTWRLDLTEDDTNAINEIYRERVAITNWRASVDIGEGIFYIDDSDEKDPKIRILTFQTNSTQVIPLEKSPQLDLSGYYFDKASTVKWGDTVLIACRTSDSSYNNRVFVYNLNWDAWDILDYNVSCFSIYNGALVAGDSISNNVYELFSGYDDLESEINSYCTTAELTLENDGLKKVKQIWINGRIQKEQFVKVYASYDNGGFTEIGEIRGDADYVDGGQAVSIGAVTLGKKEIGGGSVIEAYRYWKIIKVNSDKFNTIKIKIVPEGIGWFDFSSILLHDLRLKQQKLVQKYQ